MSGLQGVFIILIKVDCMHITQWLKQFQNVTAQNLSIVFTKFCAHAKVRMYKAGSRIVWLRFTCIKQGVEPFKFSGSVRFRFNSGFKFRFSSG